MMGGRHRLSHLFVPVQSLPPSASSTMTRDSSLSRSTRLFIQQGFIRPSEQCSGVYTLLPLAQRALDKMHQRVDVVMKSLGALRVALPHLSSIQLWDKSNRNNVLGSELFRLKDRRQLGLVLNATAEESVVSMVANNGTLTPSKLPLMLYQISTKFRDELNPKLGLIRAREFLMKDLYTFDANPQGAERTYHKVLEGYHWLMNGLDVPYFCVRGSSGAMGGHLSHEFHTPAEVGQDRVLVCAKCDRFGLNTDLEEAGTQSIKCDKCEGSNELKEHKSIEVGHCFLLGTKYSKVFKAKCAGPTPTDLEMGCFGVGTTRLLSATVEVLSSSSELRWPRVLVPYSVIVLSPKEGSKEAKASMESCLDFYDSLNNHVFIDDCLLDDRGDLTVGKKLYEAKKCGFRFVVLFGKGVMSPTPMIELHELKPGGESTLEKLTLQECRNRLEKEAEILKQL